MKVLLFTHEQDIDGIGCIILAGKVYNDLDFITCKTFEINQKVEETISNQTIYSYDFIFITDICVKEPLLSQINNDSKLKGKLLILDHHKTELEANQYDFAKVVVSNEQGKTSGTSLFYDYLISHNLLIPDASLKEFVELTRQYDTWEWKTLYNNPKARMLHILFEQLGIELYIKEINHVLKINNSFDFTLGQLKIIEDYEIELLNKVNQILNKMKIINLTIEGVTYKIGFLASLYQYRNDLSEAVVNDNINEIDLIMIDILDQDSYSFRKIKDVDVSKVATYFGGVGHKEAASCPKFESTKQIIDNLISSNTIHNI